MNNDIKKVQPFDSFTAVYKILVWAGYYKPLNKTSRLKRISHQIYRVLALLFTVVYNVQHLIFTVQHRNDVDKLMDCLVIEIPQMNMFVKVLTMTIQTPRLDKLHALLNGPIFAAIDYEDGEILRKNTAYMHCLSKILNLGVTLAALLWPISFFVKRYYNENEVVNSYMPFETDTWPKFSLSVLLETGPILWTGYGHMSIDCLIVTYYAQAQTQLKVIKHHLRYFLHSNIENSKAGDRLTQYKNLTDESIFKRFVEIVNRYEKLIWYINEVDAAFNLSLSFQFLSSASVVCLIIFRMTIISVTAFPILFLALLFCLLLTQVFIYCYYGNIVYVESQTVNDSLYDSDWVSLSPSFRRLLLIAMCRWSQPIQPRVSHIIPLSLSTFVTIVKSSYTLYTVLVVTDQNSK